jgi:stage III sporulation protein AA
MSGVSKCDGALMLLRTMSPQVIAMDEITAREDLQAVEAIMKAGVEILATLHGNDMKALLKPGIAPIYNTGVFRRAVFVELCNGVRQYTVEELNV